MHGIVHFIGRPCSFITRTCVVCMRLSFMTGAFEPERPGGTVLEGDYVSRGASSGGRLCEAASLHPRRRAQTLQSSSQSSLQAEDLLS